MEGSAIKRVVATWLLVLSTSAAWAGPFDNAVGTWWGQAEDLGQGECGA